MRKRTKAALAIGGATVLLTGGLGSTALWVDSVTTSGAPVTTGELRISDGTSEGVWTDLSTDEEFIPATDENPDGDYLVPGDRLQSPRTDFTIDARGKNLVASLRLDSSAGTLPPGVTITPVSITLDRDGDGVGSPATFNPATDTIQPGVGQRLSVTFVVAFSSDPQEHGGAASQNKPVNISDLRAIVTQARP